MSGWDAERVSSVELGLREPSLDGALPTRTDYIAKFRQFLRTHQSEDLSSFPYRKALIENYRQALLCISIDLRHLNAYDRQLVERLEERPIDLIPIFEEAAQDVVRTALSLTDPPLPIQVQLRNYDKYTSIRELDATHVNRLIKIRGIVTMAARPRIKATRLHIMCRTCKATRFVHASSGFGGLQLPRRCESSGQGGVAMPDGQKCPLDPYMVLPDTSSYIDQQRLKLQELPEHVPTGELPRHVSLSCERYLVGAVKPGSRVHIIGMYTTYETSGNKRSGAGGIGASSSDGASGGSEFGLRVPYIRVFGIEQEDDHDDAFGGASLAAADSSTSSSKGSSSNGNNSSSSSSSGSNGNGVASSGAPSGSGSGSGGGGGGGGGISDMSAAEVDDLEALARMPDLYDRITTSMCPAIFDNEDTRNIKKSLAVQLFSGSRKVLPDGMRLRGDINVLLLGDPSVAKSQFLKFVSQVAPIGVYTSGKGSSAAGLTASVIRDPGTGEFHLEGGALVLADGGLVCIDEFDKMREQDRVAIHEAMEQQTISIAKAGITTILNSRTSVLAAANPIYGRYDDMKSASENIDFQTSILSRFDLIFIVRDVQDERRDMNLARHVLNVHRYGNLALQQMMHGKEAPIPIPQLKRYISYARRKVQPRLSAEASTLLKNEYVKMRSQLSDRDGSRGSSVIPITVRQLEAIVRVSEALARMELQDVASTKHVTEAMRLFRVSTFRAATAGQGGAGGGAESGPNGAGLFGDTDRAIQAAEADVCTRLAVGAQTSTESLIRFLVQQQHHTESAARRAISIMVDRHQLVYRSQAKLVHRLQ